MNSLIPRLRCTCLTALCAAAIAWPATGADTPAAANPARALMDQVVAARQTSGFSARGRLVISKGGETARTVQFLVKGRQTAAGSDFLYLALYPAAEKGRAIVVHRDPAGKITGFLREPAGTTTPLTAAQRHQPLFGSDLTVDEMSADFWHWPSVEIKGTEKVCRRDCQIVEAKPPKGEKTVTTLVKAWISPETSLPLRVETFSSDGKLLKRTECTNVVKSGGRYSMEKLVIDSPASGQQTLVDFSKGARDIAVPAEDFTAAGIARLLE